MSEKNAPILEHLDELRSVLIHIVIALIVGTILSYILFINELMQLVMEPFTSLGLSLNFMSVTEGLLVHMKVALLGGCILASPMVLSQILSFILPALYSHEKKVFFMMLFSGIILFVGGVIFAYVFILRLGLNALLFTFSGDLIPLISASEYVSFVLSFLIPFGIVFEIPMFVYFLTMMGIITPEILTKNRKYVYLVALILAALLTPPDIVSQVALAIPMIILYEGSIKLSVMVYKQKLKKAEKQRQSYEE